MEVIARRKEGVGLMYLLCTFLGLIFVGMGIAFGVDGILLTVMGAVLGGISGYLTVSYLTLPSAIIIYDGSNTLTLPKEVKLNIKDVIDVSYRRAHGRGISYKWGSVTIKTHIGKYKYGFVAECEDVAKQLTEMMYRARLGADNE